MAVQISVTSVPPFDPHGDPNTVSQRWDRWVKSFKLFADASGCTDDRQMRQLLLHCAGSDVQDVFFTLTVADEEFDTALEALTTYFAPMVNTSYNRHKFRQDRQQEGESVGQYTTRLRGLAKLCNFPAAQVPEFIKDQVIDHCRSQKLRTKLLATRDLTLARTLDIAQAMEASERQASEINAERREPDRVYATGHAGGRGRAQFRGRGRAQSRGRGQGQYRGRGKLPPGQSRPPRDRDHETDKTQCTRCGMKGHTGQECRCSKNITCYKCSRVEHFANMCRAKTHNSETPDKAKSHVQYVESSEDSDDYAYALGGSKTLSINIDDVPVEMVIDSGATCNIINGSVADKLLKNGGKLTKCTRRIHPYGSQPIASNRCTSAITKFGTNSVNADFLVIEGDSPPLLGRSTAEALNILHIGPPDVVNHIQQDIDIILHEFPGIANGIGRFKGQEVMIHIDKSVPPVARKHIRTPFHLRAKVAQEIEKLTTEGIIEKVTGPTEWVSRIVTPPKHNSPGEIRLCIDMREANEAILRTRHVTPTLDEFIKDLSGSTVFSKVDLKAGYHQLVLHPSCRYITTFSTHVGLYQYKRLNFGVNSAVEVFQHTIQTVLEGIDGARNVSDDIIIFGKTVAEHDRALRKTLHALHKTGLTINKRKCEFRKAEIKFFGYVFNAQGISPDPQKVQDLKSVTEPSSKSEVRSFLGMAQYSARFIKGFATLTEPLRNLTKQKSTWNWGPTQSDAFNAVKNALSENTTMGFFDPQKHTEILVDASPVGLGAILAQDSKPIAYASRALSDVEQWYSQTEREALAVVWACEHFNIYINGAQVKVITDHQPLVNIWKKCKW